VRFTPITLVAGNASPFIADLECASGKQDILSAEGLGMLPKGRAKKVTIYLNQDTRAHVEPLWSAILNFLRSRHVAGATVFWADMGFGSHEQLHNPRSEYAGEHRPVRIEFIETAERVDELLPTLYDMVTDGLITAQDVMVVKSASKDRKAPQPEPLRKTVTVPAKLIQIYLGEADRYHGEPLYEAMLKKLRMMDFSGATVYRGILGYGAKGHTHKAGRFHLSHDLPIMISIVERVDKVDELIRTVASMMQEGLIVTSDAQLHRIVHEVHTGGEAIANEQQAAG
jgi:PII-like signaling protein